MKFELTVEVEKELSRITVVSKERVDVVDVIVYTSGYGESDGRLATITHNGRFVATNDFEDVYDRALKSVRDSVILTVNNWLNKAEAMKGDEE